jgi:hypothetical protein
MLSIGGAQWHRPQSCTRGRSRLPHHTGKPGREAFLALPIDPMTRSSTRSTSLERDGWGSWRESALADARLMTSSAMRQAEAIVEPLP